MKQTFNAKGSETYRTREAELKAHAEKIDALLRTPPKPGMHLSPSGQMRRNAGAHAHAALENKRVDINKELEAIKHDMAKRHIVDTPQKVQGKAKA